MKKITKRAAFNLKTLASVIALGGVTDIQAVDFNIGAIEGQLDSSLSVGTSWSTAGPDSNLIGVNNGGKGLSQTSDDSRLNFKQGETFSKIFKGVHDLELKYGDTGVFMRGKYWYDIELKDENRPFKDIDDEGRQQAAKSAGYQLLDAFAYHNYTLGERPGSLRLGKQVLSWGESNSFQNGINSINPVDVPASRRPGAQAKEGLVPVNMFFVRQGLTENLSLEAFYQITWKPTVLDNCGTFFAQSDVIAHGCNDNLRLLTNNPAVGDWVNDGLPGTLLDIDQNVEGTRVPRGPDRDARDIGQWGLALRYLFNPLNTAFGAYFVNYHSRAPFFSDTAPAQSVYNAAAAFGAAAPLVVAGNSQYFMEYPQDIRLYGLSFSTTLPTGTAWQGEISYRPNAPLQLNTTDILFAVVDPLKASVNALYGNASLLDGSPSNDLHGYRRKEITQLQTTLTQVFNQVMGAERLVLIGKVGVVHIGGLESSAKVRYGRDPIFGPGPLPASGDGAIDTCRQLNLGTVGANGENLTRYCKDEGFATRTAWGYRVQAIWDYKNVLPGINLKPNLTWSHDVDGYGPNGLFTEGAKAVTLGLGAEYQNYTTSLAYTQFFGGTYNTSIDRDFVALSVGVNF